ncbi:MAG: hypothetical protein GPOALKHO_001206 [Sodalis sp.]|uniref:hypothetical protein n=1 Tax=Sodalis sp. (in: enterobacteria) TaxID=1898979 RepID=UPI003872AB5B|nr:MAG: hypothetical protein GPOALKHO_001206 [Sodalis sp.]
MTQLTFLLDQRGLLPRRRRYGATGVAAKALHAGQRLATLLLLPRGVLSFIQRGDRGMDQFATISVELARDRWQRGRGTADIRDQQTS